MDAGILLGIPSKYRIDLGIYSLNTIVSVERDIGYLFVKNSNAQLVPILAVVFTILQTFPETLMRIVLNSIFIPLAMFVTLFQERVKVNSEKRDS